MKKTFEAYNPTGSTLKDLRYIIDIVDDYAGQGLTLTLRQLYYQLVSKDLISNNEKSYKRIGMIVSRARLGGILDWDAVEDRVRVPKMPPEYASLDALVEAAFASYRLPRLMGQDTYVELWVEKDALAGVLAPIAYKYHIGLMVNRGYSSTSAMKEAGDRLREKCLEIGTNTAHVLYLGDFDPSGEDMVRDVDDRLELFANRGYEDPDYPDDTDGEVEGIVHIDVTKIALTMPQIKKHQPPPNPAKLTDSRAKEFVAKHGKQSWEVDALPPRVLRHLIELELDSLIDMDKVQKIKDKEEADKKMLRAALKKGKTP
jgi:hypothetical protein